MTPKRCRESYTRATRRPVSMKSARRLECWARAPPEVAALPSVAFPLWSGNYSDLEP